MIHFSTPAPNHDPAPASEFDIGNTSTDVVDEQQDEENKESSDEEYLDEY